MAGFVAPGAVAAIWIGSSILRATLSGWAALAGPFGAPRRERPTEMVAVEGSLGGVDYLRHLEVGFDATHLWLDTGWLFRPFHGPLRFPLVDLEAEALSGGERVGLRLGSRGVVLAIPRAAWRTRTFGAGEGAR